MGAARGRAVGEKNIMAEVGGIRRAEQKSGARLLATAWLASMPSAPETAFMKLL
jgi:hypothetical protein